MKARSALGRGLAIAAIAAVGVPVGGAAQSGPADPAGPLFIVGGGRQPDALVARFVALAGGPGMARIAVIPLASSVPDEAGLGKIGVGIDESTALEATPGGTWRVHGAIVSDEGAPALGAGGIVMHLLPAGSTYDPRSGTLNIETRAP